MQSEWRNIYNWKGSRWIRRSTRLAIYLRDRFRCIYCRRDLADAEPRDVTLDHVFDPRPLGAPASLWNNKPTNLGTACNACNCAKKDMAFHQFVHSASARRRIRKQLQKPLNRALARALVRGRVTKRDALRTRRVA